MPHYVEPTSHPFHISVIFVKSKHWLTVHWADRPVSWAVVAVVGQKVIIKLPENVQRDATVGGRHVVVGLPEHGVEAVQGQELTEELVSEAVDVKKTFQFLSPSGTDWRTTRDEKINEWNPDEYAACFKRHTKKIPWLRWGLRSQICWWPVPKTCKGQRKPSEWWVGSDQWSGLEAEVYTQLVRPTHHGASPIKLTV